MTESDVIVLGKSILILYGLGGSGPDHWQSWLHKELNKHGEKVYYPDFPEPDHPIREEWLQRLSEVMSEIPETEELVVVAHSLACILWFHYSTSSPRRIAKKAILVCPPSINTKFEPVDTFFPLPANLNQIGCGAEKTLLIQSSNDPFCPLEDMIYYQDLGVPHITLPQMGHINIESGHGPWPLILECCLTESINLI